MTSNFDEPSGGPKKTAFQQMQDQFERQMRPWRHIQEMQELLKRYSPEYQLTDLTKELARHSEQHREIKKMLERSVIPKHMQDLMSGAHATQAQRMMDQYFPKNELPSLGLYGDAIRRLTNLDSISNIAKQYQQYLKPISEHQEMLGTLRSQVHSAFSATEFSRQLEEANSAFRAIEEANRSLDRLWPALHNIDLRQFDSSEKDEKETKHAADSIAREAAAQESLQGAIEQIVLAIQAQRKPTVQLMLWLFFRRMVDWLIAGAIGAAMGHYAPAFLGESPQAAKRAVQQNARIAVGSPQLLMEYRYVSAKVLVVRQNPRARSPEVGRLPFGKAVKLLKKEKDFALVLWTDKENGAEIQGWVFSRYLGKFR